MSLTCPQCKTQLSDNAEDCGACHASTTLGTRFRLNHDLGASELATLVYAGQSHSGPVAVRAYRLVDWDWNTLDAIRRGAELARGLEHSGIGKVIDILDDSAGNLYVVQERFTDSLSDRVRRGRRLDGAAVHALLQGTLATLAYLHRLMPPVLHGDLRPSNIMFRGEQDWRPVLVDLDPPPADAHTLAAWRHPKWCPPEARDGELSPASDLYGLGLSLLYAVSHVEPDQWAHKGTQPDLGDALRGLDPATRALLLSLADADPKKRPPSAVAALNALKPKAPDPTKTPLAPPHTSGHPGQPWSEHLLSLVLVALVATGLALGLAWGLPWATREITGPVCTASWLSASQEGGKTCVHYRSDDHTLQLACAQSEDLARLYCRRLAAQAHTAPDVLRESGLDEIRNLAQRLGLTEIIDGDVLRAAFAEALHDDDDASAPESKGSGAAEKVRTKGATRDTNTVTLVLVTEPPGAELRWEGGSCQAPCTVTFPYGAVEEITISHPGYLPLTRKVRALSDKQVDFALQAR